MSHDFTPDTRMLRRRAMSNVLEAMLPDLERSAVCGDAADEASPAPEAHGLASVLEPPMRCDPHRKLDEQAPTHNPLAQMTQLQGGAAILLVPASTEHIVMGLQDRGIEWGLINRGEAQHLIDQLTCFVHGGGDA